MHPGAYPPEGTIRRTLLRLEYQTYSGCLSRFFGIQPLAPRETIALDGKVLRGSYECPTDDPTVDSHPAIMLGLCLHCGTWVDSRTL